MQNQLKKALQVRRIRLVWHCTQSELVEPLALQGLEQQALLGLQVQLGLLVGLQEQLELLV
jgi:hypothetical protein